ncbi:hypothetical protein SK128_002790 [Halocaridina rubra]|uniref:Uncharacterized protein n=1 Tax=Halocaridina rubra TaxID=373956 RepID=A0AAN9A5W9_HALRR
MKVSDIHLPAIVKNITFPPMLMITWAGKWGGKSIGGVSRVWRPSVKQGLFQEIHVLKIEEIWCKNVLSAKDSPTPQLEAQKNLCEKYDGYGAFCSCPLLPLANKELKESKGLVMTNTVVVIMASRPTSLHRLLVSLTESSVIAKENILVFTNQPSAPELTLVCQSHGIYTEWTGRASDCEGLHNSRLYEAGLMASLILRPKGMFFLVLEDDMEIEPDIFA